jgi:hypothetical protein
MGCSTSKDLETALNSQIDIAQSRKKNEDSHKIHLMILGTGDSGKTSTFLDRLDRSCGPPPTICMDLN